MTPTITVLTETGAIDLDATSWRRDDSGDVYVYDDASEDEDADPVATIDSNRFVAAFHTEHGTHDH